MTEVIFESRLDDSDAWWFRPWWNNFEKLVLFPLNKKESTSRASVWSDIGNDQLKKYNAKIIGPEIDPTFILKFETEEDYLAFVLEWL